MNPGNFIEKWGVTRQELAQLTGKSVETVNRWFSDREPGSEIITLLSSIDLEWTIREALDKLPSHIWAIYELAKARKEAERLRDEPNKKRD
jgi:transcriptional regulator with XRE-family HTH domain